MEGTSPTMSSIPFITDYIKNAKPKMPFRYALTQEGHYLQEMERAELLAQTAHLQKREETETEEIIAALEKEKNDIFLEKKRCQQLKNNSMTMRQLYNYLSIADVRKSRIAQLKLEDAEIDRRFENAKEQAQEIRAEYRAAEEHEKLEEAKKTQNAKELCMILKAQIAEHEEKSKLEREERMRDRNELMERLNNADEIDRKDAQAAFIAKTQLRKEMIENLRVRSERRKIENTPNKNDLTYYYEVEDENNAFKQKLKDVKNQKLRQKEALSAKLGEDVLAKNIAKRQAVTDLIDYWYNWQQNHNNFLYEKEQQKENEIRKGLQQTMMFQAQQREEHKKDQLKATTELAQKRQAQSHHDNERILLHKRMERERWESDLWEFKKIAAERAKEKAEELEKNLKHSNIELEMDKLEKEIEATRIKVLNEQPLSLLRYLPSKVVRSDYLPQPLREIVREEIQRDPIPMFNQKRHKPHLKRARAQGGDLIKCCKSCPPRKPISNIF